MGREKILSSFLYLEDLVLHSESEEDLKVTNGHFVEVCKSSGLNVYDNKSMVMVLLGEKELVCEVFINGM